MNSSKTFLVLPCKRKLQYITSSIDKDQLLRETFDKVQTLQQKNVFLLVDKVQIRPTVSFSGGLLSGMAENNRDCKVTSILSVVMESLHKGPSLMISDTCPQADAAYQLERVMEAAAAVERASGRVIGSITDNHKVNQQYCKLFERLATTQFSFYCDGETQAQHTELTGLLEGRQVEVWVTAATRAGDGPASAIVSITPSQTVGAGIYAVGGQVKVGRGTDILLPCPHVGSPKPELNWEVSTAGGQDRSEQQPDSSLLIRDCRRMDSGNYTCHVTNTHAADSLTYALLVLGERLRLFELSRNF
ncbi:Immunoglobulin-like domain [Trinorchestia longiramus]|nr:Immunoglobulin-like domain [Trinorchestia longiramus]